MSNTLMQEGFAIYLGPSVPGVVIVIVEVLAITIMGRDKAMIESVQTVVVVV